MRSEQQMTRSVFMIMKVLTVLQDLGYKPPKVGLNIVEAFSEF
jgi:hypothetical protein